MVMDSKILKKNYPIKMSKLLNFITFFLCQKVKTKNPYRSTAKICNFTVKQKEL